MYQAVRNGAVNPDAAWYYPEPSPASREIQGHVTFWHGIKVVQSAGSSQAAE